MFLWREAGPPRTPAAHAAVGSSPKERLGGERARTDVETVRQGRDKGTACPRHPHERHELTGTSPIVPFPLYHR